MSDDTESTQELRVLRMVKRVLTDIAKDTNTPPGMQHPLSNSTIMGIKDCLALITARESEIQEVQSRMQPRYPDQIGNQKDNVVVSLKSSSKSKKKNKNKTDK